MSTRSEALARRVEEAHQELMAFIESCSEEDWQRQVPGEGRSVGVLIHHVASSLPTEMELTQTLASGQAITGVTPDGVNQMNAEHARVHASCTQAETLALLKQNSIGAVTAIRALSDDQLDRAATVSLHADAPLTAQYFIEDHPLLHTYHHLQAIQAAPR